MAVKAAHSRQVHPTLILAVLSLAGLASLRPRTEAPAVDRRYATAPELS